MHPLGMVKINCDALISNKGWTYIVIVCRGHKGRIIGFSMRRIPILGSISEALQSWVWISLLYEVYPM